jgi:hypothetical protein
MDTAARIANTDTSSAPAVAAPPDHPKPSEQPAVHNEEVESSTGEGSNKALAFAAIQGTVITFWLRALRGTTLGQMHRDWSYGLYVWQAIVFGRNCSLLALVCVCATIVAMDGPLLQRASSVRSVIPDSPVTLAVSVSPEVPSYFTGHAFYPLRTKDNVYFQFRDDFLPIVREHISKTPMRGAVTGCHIAKVEEERRVQYGILRATMHWSQFPQIQVVWPEKLVVA